MKKSWNQCYIFQSIKSYYLSWDNIVKNYNFGRDEIKNHINEAKEIWTECLIKR